MIVDKYSKWEVKQLKSRSSAPVIEPLRSVFSTHGILEVIFGDNNLLNSFECREYARSSIGCKIVTSSPEYPSSNGCRTTRSQSLLPEIVNLGAGPSSL